MCAINGFTGENRELILAMNRATAHRGPDGSGTYVAPEISLGHNRLAIIDLSPQAAQPMHSFDGKHIVVLNGEIYNYRELRAELGDYPFKTQSDTEVILAAYRKWGAECFKKLNGMFAIALWDAAHSELVLARDHTGIKPLYYCQLGDTLIFSSEMQGILVHQKVSRALNTDALRHYLRLLYVPESQTMIHGVMKLPPGHFALFRNGSLSVRRFWLPELTPLVDDSSEDMQAEVRRLTDAAVARQLVSDRPLGVFLSGGFDSAVVVSAMSRVTTNIKTFSVGFELDTSEEPEKFNADALLAKKTAEYFGTAHHEVMLSANEFLTLLPDAIEHLSEPIANATAVAQMKLASFARERVVVTLGGDGGDELFGGYERYRLSRFMSRYRALVPAPLRLALRAYPTLRKLDAPPGVERFALFHFQKDPVLRSIVNPELLSSLTKEHMYENYFRGRAAADFEQLFMDVDRRSWLVDESLARTDAMTMSAALEQRVPLLDVDLVEYAARIPTNKKISGKETKKILKDAFRDRLPAHLYDQPKRGWFSPTAKWLRRPAIAEFAREVLSEGYNKNTKGFFQWDGVERMLDEHLSRKRYNLTALWAVLVFQVWARVFRLER